MPRRTDIASIAIIGAGPIVIGQACEFDYSGVQACKALKAEGYRVILINSNPATIMTDPNLADATYIEPITPDFVARILEAERPDALLPTMGGQTALNTAMALAGNGTLERLGIELIGANRDSRSRRPRTGKQFRDAMLTASGMELPEKPWSSKSFEEALRRAGRGRPARHHPPVLHAWAAPAAASPTIKTAVRGDHPLRPCRLSGARKMLSRGIGAGLEGI